MNCKTDFYADESNFMFIKKGSEGQLLDHIFIHLSNSDGTSYLVHFDSFIEDDPLEVFKMVKVDLKEDLASKLSSIPIDDLKEEQAWKRIRVNGMLPSKWKLLFEKIEGQINQQ